MDVQIYEQGTDKTHEAEDQERQSLLIDLGITREEQQDVIPFPELSRGEYRVYETLFPGHHAWDKYPGYIPTRVLRTIKAYRETFVAIEVWADQKADPVLIGRKEKHSSDGCFLLARWGAAIEPFDVLRIRAMELWGAKRKASIEAVLLSVPADTLAYFNGEYVGSPI